MKSIAFLFLAVAGFSCTQAHAWETFRCDNDLAMVKRDSRASIVRKCGEPFFTQPLSLSCRPTDLDDMNRIWWQAHAPYIVQSGLNLCLLVDDWYYNPGPGQFLTILRFEGKGLQSIRFGERIR